jgi:hypothetical protein
LVLVNVPLADYLPYLGLTLAIEVPIAALLLGRRCGWWRSVLGALVASGFTNPLLWYVWPLVISPHQYVRYAASGETLVVLLETAILFGMVVRQGRWSSRGRAWAVAFGVSLLANAASLGTGLVINALR